MTIRSTFTCLAAALAAGVGFIATTDAAHARGGPLTGIKAPTSWISTTRQPGQSPLGGIKAPISGINKQAERCQAGYYHCVPVSY
jgi:hypothetical protein